MLALIFFLAFPFVLFSGWRKAQAARATADWPATTGTILSAALGQGRLRRQPRFTYRYSVNGQDHIGTRITYAGVVEPKRADEYLAKYPVGTPVIVHYQPNAPTESVIEAGDGAILDASNRSLIYICLVLAVVSGLGFLLKFALRPNARDEPHIRTYGDPGTLPGPTSPTPAPIPAGINYNEQIAFMKALSSAAFGDAHAQATVGIDYMNGAGVKRDDNLAVNWLTKSAAQNDPDGMNNLAVLYLAGRGGPANSEKAAELLRKAADIRLHGLAATAGALANETPPPPPPPPPPPQSPELSSRSSATPLLGAYTFTNHQRGRAGVVIDVTVAVDAGHLTLSFEGAHPDGSGAAPSGEATGDVDAAGVFYHGKFTDSFGNEGPVTFAADKRRYVLSIQIETVAEPRCLMFYGEHALNRKR